ncbi:hypothetical protein FC52_GL001083 [Lactobacillus pasteurii DSM 23907 = CRBIP 24.76]|nr:hypothetical protein FC52_GL001083 [Lactobacillus pasteurii DSM 23907 = CRBIP 24.76]
MLSLFYQNFIIGKAKIEENAFLYLLQFFHNLPIENFAEEAIYTINFTLKKYKMNP